MSATRVNVRLDTSLETLVERAPASPGARVLATVVATAGSTYRKAGARMLIMQDGSYVGLLSGGCLESDLILHAREVMESGTARAVEYDMRGPDDVLFGIGTGCEGAMRVLLEPAAAGQAAFMALEAAEHVTRAGRAAVLFCVHDSRKLPLGTRADIDPLPPALDRAARESLLECRSVSVDVADGDARTRALVQFLAPVPHLLVCGAGPDARPVVAAARGLGWRVTVVDHRPPYALPENFPGAAVRLSDPRRLDGAVDLELCHAAVVMSHHLPSDAAYLHVLAEHGRPAYVGLLGPGARRARLVGELGPADETFKRRVHGPVGLDIGAVTPEGIAIAIVGEIHAWLAGRVGEPGMEFAGARG
jgi:xanthine/CO dehydrogenase XdhC/CoxF family maturation factor